MDGGQPDPEPGLENEDMFDLDAAMREWRDSFGESLRVDDLNELEEHLRAQVQVLAPGRCT